MARWAVTAARRGVPVWVMADRVIEHAQLEEDRVRWIVEVPHAMEALLWMVPGVLSVDAVEPEEPSACKVKDRFLLPRDCGSSDWHRRFG